LIDPRHRFDDLNLSLPEPSWPVLQRDFETPPDCGEKSYVGHGRLKGRKALITGGDSGIGRAIAIAFAREGADVAINYLPEEEPDAEDVAKLFEDEGKHLIRLPGDLLNETFCGELIRMAHDRLGGLDLLVNHAGYESMFSAHQRFSS
jgi:NAD(P)-dependent dehydrogenase (short-subunit alcohol dehydrogenase family)